MEFDGSRPILKGGLFQNLAILGFRDNYGQNIWDFREKSLKFWKPQEILFLQ